MKIKIAEQPERINKYYIEILNDFYLKKLRGELLDWWFFSDPNYFLIHHKGYNHETRIETDYYDEYKGCTPFILIDRRENNYRYTGETEKDFEENKFIIHTLGCDDGDKGWIFKDKHSALSWYAYLKKEIFKKQIHIEHEWKDYYQFLDHFEENQRWQN